MNAVLEMCDVPPILGHGTTDSPTDFVAFKEAGLVLLDDPIINLPALALSEITVPRKILSNIQGRHLLKNFKSIFLFLILMSLLFNY